MLYLLTHRIHVFFLHAFHLDLTVFSLCVLFCTSLFLVFSFVLVGQILEEEMRELQAKLGEGCQRAEQLWKEVGNLQER